ncbi:hypothetical protein [Flavobacterium sp. 3HN19-14]|uniref:hypothetical protein n=1 Tax=Flavobacterium sp. 3HN19-14 TaxID=3448133 RepID=UPI003EE4012C
MPVLEIPKKYKAELRQLDAAIQTLHESKIRVLFAITGITLSDQEFSDVVEWELIIVTVKDRQMLLQLNKLAAYVPNLKFMVDTERDIFSLVQGDKKRRVWKER